MGLQIFWFILIAVLWTGFFVLEGFDLGVGLLHGVVGHTDVEQRVAINTIGPFWDGNEVWLVVGAAGLFAAFPAWYATMFSSMYLALLLVLVALIFRGLSFEYRGKRDSARWRRSWSVALTVGSALIPLVLGIGLGDLLAGLPINSSGVYTGKFWNLLTPYGIWVGLTLLSLCALHGSTFLILKGSGAVLDRARALAIRVVWVAVVGVTVFAVWTQAVHGGGAVIPRPLQVLAVIAVLFSAWLVSGRHDGWAFITTTVAIGSTVASLFVALYPDVMVSSTNKAYSLTVASTASGHYTLQVMTVIGLVFLPLVLVYQAWTYYVFRRRVTAPPAAGAPRTEVPSERS